MCGLFAFSGFGWKLHYSGPIGISLFFFPKYFLFFIFFYIIFYILYNILYINILYFSYFIFFLFYILYNNILLYFIISLLFSIFIIFIFFPRNLKFTIRANSSYYDYLPRGRDTYILAFNFGVVGSNPPLRNIKFLWFSNGAVFTYAWMSYSLNNSEYCLLMFLWIFCCGVSLQ